jgi:hypothetical protein
MTIMLSGSDLTVMAVARLGESVALAPRPAGPCGSPARSSEVLPTIVSSELASSVKADGMEDRATIDLRAGRAARARPARPGYRSR